MTAFAPISGFPGGHFNAEATVQIANYELDSTRMPKQGTPTEIAGVPARLVPANSQQAFAHFRHTDSVGYMLHLSLTRPDTGADLIFKGQDRAVINGVAYQAQGLAMRYASHQEVPVTEEAR